MIKLFFFCFDITGLHLFLWCCGLLGNSKRRFEGHVLQGTNALQKLQTLIWWVYSWPGWKHSSTAFVHTLSRFCTASRIRLARITGSSSQNSFHHSWKRDFQPVMVCRCRPCWHEILLIGENNLSDQVKFPNHAGETSNHLFLYLQVKSAGGLLSVCGNYLLLEPKTCDGLRSYFM